MKKVIVLTLVLFINASAYAWISSYSDASVSMDLYTSFGPFTIYGATLPITDMDSMVAMVSTSTLTHTSGIEMDLGYYAFTDFGANATPVLLAKCQSGYFVNVPNEAPVTFSVYYINSSGVEPLPGYPCVSFWKDGTSSTVSVVLDKFSTDATGALYKKSVAIDPGVYCYTYTVKNSQYAGGYTLAQSSFVVTGRPAGVADTSLPDAKVVTSGKIQLSWTVSDTQPVSFKVYAGKDQNNLTLVYTGSLPTCLLTSLDAGSNYYWQVETINQYGVSSRSPIHNFTTLGKMTKSFNYPNPFSPPGQHTNFVVDMAEAGSAEVTVYSEFGDKTWNQSFNNLPMGQNELSYNGTDGNGKVLYNGTYVAIIKKHYSGREEQDHVRIMVVK